MKKDNHHTYEAICDDNKKYGFYYLETWLNLEDLDNSDEKESKLKAGRSLHKFSEIIKSCSKINLVNKEGK